MIFQKERSFTEFERPFGFQIYGADPDKILKQPNYLKKGNRILLILILAALSAGLQGAEPAPGF